MARVLQYWKQWRKVRIYPSLRFHPGTCLEGLKKVWEITVKTVSVPADVWSGTYGILAGRVTAIANLLIVIDYKWVYRLCAPFYLYVEYQTGADSMLLKQDWIISERLLTVGVCFRLNTVSQFPDNFDVMDVMLKYTSWSAALKGHP
jgi:hypothetical protein